MLFATYMALIAMSKMMLKNKLSIKCTVGGPIQMYYLVGDNHQENNKNASFKSSISHVGVQGTRSIFC